MSTPSTAEKNPAAPAAPDAITVTIGRDAANQDGVAVTATPETLESLQRAHGAPNKVLVRLVFEGYDPEEGLARGRTVATTRILQAVPAFAQQTAACWASLPDALRVTVVGYHPGVLAVLLAEGVALRDVNLRYDARALASGAQRETIEADAREAARSGRALADQVVRMATRWAPAEYLRRHPLPAQIEGGVQSPDVLAASLDTVASWLTAWRGTWGEEERAGYEMLQFTDGQPGALHAAAARVRQTAGVAAAFSDVTPITQRELDAQDGRVLHVVELIWSAFRQAARNDARIPVPDLGELTSVFDRPSKRSADAKPAPDPAPVPAPAPDGDPTPR